MNKAVTRGPGHHGVDLGDDQLRIVHSCSGDIHRDTQTAISKSVGWTHLYEGHIKTDAPSVKKPWNLREVRWDVINFALESGFTHGETDKKELQGKPPQERFIVNIIRQSLGEHLIYGYVIQFTVLDHGPDQILGFPGACADENSATGFYL
jgi:hypothetical protein